MKLVVIESPYEGEPEFNIEYVCECVAHARNKNEAAYISQGTDESFAWGAKADLRVFYVDLGWSRGMKNALVKYRIEGSRYMFRVLGKPWSWLVGPLGPDGETTASRSWHTPEYYRKLEAEGLIERDEWPNGDLCWRLKENRP